MEANVCVINPRRGMYAAEIENRGEFVILELLDSSEPEIGDLISHPNFYSLGSEKFANLTKGNEIGVFVEDVCGKQLVKQRCLL